MREDYKGWTIYVRWHYSFWGAAEGWTCKPIGPGETVRTAISLGRHGTGTAALEAGRRWVDLKLNPPIKKRASAQTFYPRSDSQ